MTCYARISKYSGKTGDARMQTLEKCFNQCGMYDMRMLCNGIRTALLYSG